MKLNKKIFLIILIIFYLLVMQKIISMFLFPNNDFNLFLGEIQQELSAYGMIIKIIIILIALSIIPGCYILKRAFEEDLPPHIQKMFPILVLAISAIIPTMALLNAFLTGDLLLSSMLIIYGLIFTTFTYKNV